MIVGEDRNASCGFHGCRGPEQEEWRVNGVISPKGPHSLRGYPSLAGPDRWLFIAFSKVLVILQSDVKIDR